MTTLYPAPSPVKPAPFGRGILPTSPAYRSPASEADRAWWAAQTLGPESARDYDLEAGSAAAVDRMGAGIPLF
jgi:hypothetical protein